MEGALNVVIPDCLLDNEELKQRREKTKREEVKRKSRMKEVDGIPSAFRSA